MSYNLEPMDPADKGKTSVPFNLGSGQPLSTNPQFAQVDLLPRFHPIMPLNVGSQQMSLSDRHFSHGMFQASPSIREGSYQLAFTNKQSVQTGTPLNVQAPIAAYTGFQQSSSTYRSLVEKQSSVNVNVLPVNVGAQSQLSGSKKRSVKRERQPKFQTPMPVNLGSQHLLSAQRWPSQMEPPPKPQTELIESVRSKLRESLAGALAMVSNQQSKSQPVIKNPPEGTGGSTLEEAEVGTELVKLSPPSSTPACESYSEILTSNEHVMKDDDGQNPPSNEGPNESIVVNTNTWKHDLPEDRPLPVGFEEEGQFSSNTITNDELLQVYGLCWADAEDSEALMNQEPKRAKLIHQEANEDPKLVLEEVTEGTKDKPIQVSESLATKIEAELFRLFGGVNKKYKEKGRSLLFNLKDRNNPELRERVLSGDIAPERLCSMTAEELASKELSEWRLAKAEELAQMVVLPDSDVDIRRLVKKTHKGEFQVEVDQDDSVSVEVGVGANALTSFLMKSNEETQTQSKSGEGQVISNSQETKAPGGPMVTKKANSSDQNVSTNSDNLNEKTEFLQDFIVDELKDANSLPAIVSLDEFMEALDSEPPFENMSMDTAHDISDAAEKNLDSSVPETNAESDILGPKSDTASSSLVSKLEPTQDSLQSKLNSEDTISDGPHGTSVDSDNKETAMGNTSNMVTSVEVDVMNTKPASDLKSRIVHVEADTCHPDTISKSETIWDGLIQLNISAVCTVTGSFRSGEKTTTKEWPKFLEIKGRVRVDAFEKFLQELPHSRSRAIMLAEFCWKEGSDENGHLHLRETIDSYILDERVGFSQPAPGVELYLCPPHPKTTEMLGRHLPEDHMKMLRSIVNGLIGVVVWRRPHVTTISPRLSSHHKHGTSSKKQLSTNRQQQNVLNSNSTHSRSSVPNPSRPPLMNPSEEPIDDIPPGFGPGSARDNDDLPEFDFAHSRSKPTAAAGIIQLPPPLPSRPESQMRELIQKYGQGKSARKIWNDDDDIPEWQPDQQQPQSQPQPQPQQLPPPPPPSFPQQMFNYPQQAMQPPPFLVNQHLGQAPLHLQMPQAHAEQQQQQMFMQPIAPLPIPQQPLLQPQQMALVSGQQNVHMAQWWPPPPPPRGPADGGMGVALPMNGFIQPCNFGGQTSDVPLYGMPAAFGASQIGMGWRPDLPRGRGP